MWKTLLRALYPLITMRESAFWTGTVNLFVQAVVRGLTAIFPDNDWTPFGTAFADTLLLVIPYAIGRVISNTIKPEKPEAGDKPPVPLR